MNKQIQSRGLFYNQERVKCEKWKKFVPPTIVRRCERECNFNGLSAARETGSRRNEGKGERVE